MWPRDVSCVEDLPADLAVAIEQAVTILSWQENLVSEEMPPKWMWHLDWEIENWFIAVKNKREARYNKDPSDDSEGSDSDWEDNEYAQKYKQYKE